MRFCSGSRTPRCHKSLSAWQAFLSHHDCGPEQLRARHESQKPVGLAGISVGMPIARGIRLHCGKSQKPVGLAGISVGIAHHLQISSPRCCHKSLSAWQAFLSEQKRSMTTGQTRDGHKSLSAWQAFLSESPIICRSARRDAVTKACRLGRHFCRNKKDQ